MKEKRKDGGNVPNLRFKGFEGEGNTSYKKHYFKDIFLFSTGKNIKQNEASPEFEIPCVRYGELYHMYNEVITEVVNKTNLDKSELFFSQGNEILLPSAGEDPLDIGSASALTIENVAIGRTINVLKPAQDNIYSPIYAAYYINCRLRQKISTLAKGVSISNVYNSDLKTLEIILPSLPEQQKVVSILSLLEKRISIQSKIIRQLESLIKGLSEKLFTKLLRFKNDDGNEFPEWEAKKIENILTIGSGKDYKHLGIGSVPVFGTGGLMTYVNSCLYEGETVCIGRKGTINKPMYYNGKIWTVDTLFYTHSFLGCFPKFIFYVFKTINWKLYNEASGVPSLSKNTIEKIEIELPSLREQIKIADYLFSIEEKIQIEKKLMQQYEHQKKYLLQNLFI